MATFELVLLLAVAVLLSSILDQVVPKISSPLIQIALGVIIAFLAITPVQINIDPELFLVLFIAPLLFSDAMESNKQNLWENKGVIAMHTSKMEAIYKHMEKTASALRRNRMQAEIVNTRSEAREKLKEYLKDILLHSLHRNIPLKNFQK